MKQKFPEEDKKSLMNQEIFNRQLKYARKIVSERLEALRTARESVEAWNSARAKIHPNLKTNIDDNRYEALLRLFLDQAEAQTWFYRENPFVYILYEEGVPTEKIDRVVHGTKRLSVFGVNYEVKVIPKPNEVSQLVRRITNRDGKMILKGNEGFGSIQSDLVDLVKEDNYRPGLVLVLDRPTDPELEGTNPPGGVIIPKGWNKTVHPVDLTATHEMIHYLKLDGGTSSDYQDSHCLNHCYMNCEKLSNNLCDLHLTALKGYHKGVIETLKEKGILKSQNPQKMD